MENKITFDQENVGRVASIESEAVTETVLLGPWANWAFNQSDREEALCSMSSNIRRVVLHQEESPTQQRIVRVRS